MTTKRRRAVVPRVAVPPVVKVAVSPPARAAGMKRALKFGVFGVVGTVLANAAALAASVAIGVDAPAQVIAVTSLLAGSFAAGVQKSMTWKDVPPPEPSLAMPAGRIEP